MIFHVDANSFYASCEQLFRPDLDGKPIAVLSNNDGVIIALNQECKNLGLKRGDTYFTVRDRCRAWGVNVFSSNYTLYADISTRLNILYSAFAPETEIYSIDESFLYFPNWNNADFPQMGMDLKHLVMQSVHMPVSVGIAPTKTLSKLCNKLAKSRGGVCFWDNMNKDYELKSIATSDIWGIGLSKTRTLARHGIHTALDLKNMSLDKAKKLLTIQGMKTVQELNEISALDCIERETRQNITTSKSFAQGVADLPQLETALAEYTQLAVYRMRNEKSACAYISIYLMTARQYDRSRKDEEYFNGATAQFNHPTSFLPEILAAGTEILRTIYREGYKYRKVMVNLLGLEADNQVQGDLFEDTLIIDKKKQDAVMTACDQINRKYGRLCLHPGSRNAVKDISPDGQYAQWHMKRDFLSPSYTTQISSVPRVW